jgi:hypothetical protein
MPDFTDIAAELRTQLTRLAKSSSFQEAGRKQRTRRITTTLGEWADSNPEWTAYYSGNSNKKHCEWLFDVAALELPNGWLLNAPLLVESELGSPSEVQDDFQRLLLARADVRVLVFQQRDAKRADTLISELDLAISKYRSSEPTDRYFFACYLSDEKRFLFQSRPG